MVQGISASTALPEPTRFVPTPNNDTGRAYAADWFASASPRAAAATLPLAANDRASPTRARETAPLAADVYNDIAAPPAGWRVADRAALDRLGITSAVLESPNSSFRARVYETGTGDDVRYVVAFRGSSAGEDWLNNGQQALGLNSESYAKALRIGKELARSDADVTLTGHSLGGGLASAAAIAGGRQADTYNAAGLHADTIADARAVASAEGRGVSAVQAYHVPGEVLTSLQNNGLVDVPQAYGAQSDLPFVRPAGVNWLERLNPVSRHGMDWVLAGVNALR